VCTTGEEHVDDIAEDLLEDFGELIGALPLGMIETMGLKRKATTITSKRAVHFLERLAAALEEKKK
jgi:hypothetical protein